MFDGRSLTELLADSVLAGRRREQSVSMPLIWPAASYVKYVLGPVVLPIPKGPLKGRKWSVASGLKFFFGGFEPEKSTTIQAMVGEGKVVYDIGAHVGYFSVLMSGVVGAEGRVVAFEPRPLNLAYLRRHVRINRCRNVQIVEACVGEHNGTCRFEARCKTTAGNVSPNGNLTVRMVCLDELYSSGTIPAPDFVKIDVEGSELMVLEGAQRIICDHHPPMLIATHTKDLDRLCADLLSKAGYRLQIVRPFHGDWEALAIHDSFEMRK